MPIITAKITVVSTGKLQPHSFMVGAWHRFQIQIKSIYPEVICFYYTALLNPVECSVHLHGPSRLPVVNCFSIMTVAMHIMTTVKVTRVFRINLCVTYPPQRTRLLSDVNVFGGQFLCWSTLRLLVTNHLPAVVYQTHHVKLFFRFGKSPCGRIMYWTSAVIIGK